MSMHDNIFVIMNKMFDAENIAIRYSRLDWTACAHFFFHTLCHNRNERVHYRCWNLKWEKNWTNHRKKRFQWHVFDYCFDFSFFLPALHVWTFDASIDRFLPLTELATVFNRNEHIFIWDTRETTIIICLNCHERGSHVSHFTHHLFT